MKILLTGATGLLGAQVVDRLLRSDPEVQLAVLVRDLRRWESVAAMRELWTTRVEPLVGDVTVPGLGIATGRRRLLTKEVEAVIHMAADVVFSRQLAESRATNVEGTRNVLDVLEGRSIRFAHVSTAFVVGRSTGEIRERAANGQAGWVNAYEQSKWEAEELVRASAADFVIFRPSTVVCDDVSGRVSQYNAVHRSLRLFHAGMAPMIPGTEDSPVDLVTAEYVAEGIARLALRPELSGAILHLCAGTNATTLGRLLDLSFEVWSADEAWRRRAIAPPILTELATYRMFEKAVEETGDARLIQVARSLTHFAPQLALPKRFDTTRAKAMLGREAPPVEAYWARMLEHLRGHNWGRDTTKLAA